MRGRIDALSFALTCTTRAARAMVEGTNELAELPSLSAVDHLDAAQAIMDTLGTHYDALGQEHDKLAAQWQTYWRED